MKRWAILTLIGLSLAAILSSLGFVVLKKEMISTLYTVAGVMFSVGISMVISINTREVRNKDAKKYLKSDIGIVIREFLLFFGSLTFVFVLLFGSEGNAWTVGPVKLNGSVFLLVYSILCIGYFAYNFLQARKLNDRIEDILGDEAEN